MTNTYVQYIDIGTQYTQSVTMKPGTHSHMPENCAHAHTSKCNQNSRKEKH